jgi:hypothetical protein
METPCRIHDEGRQVKAIFAGQDQRQEIAKGAYKPGHFHTTTILDENPTSCQRKINEAEKDSV